MKKNIIMLFTLFALLSCKKDNKDNNKDNSVNKEDILGKWVNTANNIDTLFINDTIIKRIDTTTMLFKHKYSYTLYKESITIMYTGEYYIYLPESSHKITLDQNNAILTIENLSNYFPKYAGNEFKKNIK